MEKLHSYQGWGGRFHEWRDNIKVKYANWREENPETLIELVKKKATQPNNNSTYDDDDFSHINRPKERHELVRISSAVMGIEFSYSAETAFVSPTLLKIGVEHQHMTLVWALSPLVGFFLTPLLGSLSDKCRLNLGRRRPFIILLSIGVFLGLLLVPNGERLGYAFGDFNPYAVPINESTVAINSTERIFTQRLAAAKLEIDNDSDQKITPHPWGILFTIIGTVFLDFSADACQSPARAYLLDVTIPDDHAKGLSTFTIMAGLGGFMGYSLGGIDWDNTIIGKLFGGHVRAVFTIVTFIFIICVSVTISSFREIPLWKQESKPVKLPDFLEDDLVEDKEVAINETNLNDSGSNETQPNNASYGSVGDGNVNKFDRKMSMSQKRYTAPPPIPTHSDYADLPGQTVYQDDQHPSTNGIQQNDAADASIIHYLMSIIFMPHSLRMVCLTNLFCWMAHVCYSLYFTDFVGESVFGGDPKAARGSTEQRLYEEGVRFGCWGMAMYSLSCSCYSLVIEKLIRMFRAKRVYIGGLLFYCCGMTLMALTRARVSVIVFSWAAGVMYSTLFTMPYLLIAHYHSQGTFEVTADGEAKLNTNVRGLGTDIAIVSSMVFLAQFILSLCMGSIVYWSGTTTAVVSVASFLSFCGAISATQIMYLDL